MDHDLPFHYWTLNERYNLGEDVRGFDDTPEYTPRLHQLRHRSREDSSIIAPGRAFLPAQHRPSLRQRLYRYEVSLPAVPEEYQDYVQMLTSKE